MRSWRRTLGSGVLAWLAPFVVAFLVFPFHESNRPLFESVMAVAVTGTAVVLGLNYLKRFEGGSVREGILLGFIWLLMCIAIDAPLMLFGGPMQMSLGAYMADIGLTYLIFPVVTWGLATALQHRSTRDDDLASPSDVPPA